MAILVATAMIFIIWEIKRYTSLDKHDRKYHKKERSGRYFFILAMCLLITALSPVFVQVLHFGAALTSAICSAIAGVLLAEANIRRI